MNPGDQITPSITLVRPLGQGAMGSVWVAHHSGLDVQVAVKFMSPALAKDSSLMQRFRREASAAAQLKSPHVAQVFDHGLTSEGSPYIVMELLEGQDLEAYFERRGGTLPVPELIAIVRQLAKALSRAHAAGIVHRDIKPANIFVHEDDGELHIKLLDFGIAKQSNQEGLEMTSTGAMVGTPYFMSPEQFISAKHVDFRSDLWAVGVVAYRALTGTIPFRAETLGGMSLAVHTGAFKPPSALRPELGPEVDAWFAKAFTKDPDGRFASARQMADELERALTGRTSGSPRMSEPEVHRARDGSAPPKHFSMSAPTELAASPGLPPQPGKGEASGSSTDPSNPGAGASAKSLDPAGSLVPQGQTLSGASGARRSGLRAAPLVVGIGLLLTMAAVGLGVASYVSREPAPAASAASAEGPSSALPTQGEQRPSVVPAPPPPIESAAPSSSSPAAATSTATPPIAPAPSSKTTAPKPAGGAPSASARKAGPPPKDDIGF